MTTTTKVLLAGLGLAGLGGGAWAVRYYGRWDVASGRHREWKYRISRKAGVFTVYVAQPGFGEQSIGDYPSKPAALERAITYIDQNAAPPRAGVSTSSGPTLQSVEAHPVVERARAETQGG